MEKIVSSGKDLEQVLENILNENNLSKEEIVYHYTTEKKGLFKNEVIEVSVYKKEDIYEDIKKFLKEVINNLGLEVSFELKKKDTQNVIVMYSNNNNILIGHNGNTLKALENIVRQKILLETGIYFIVSLDVENYKDKKDERIERLAKKLAREVEKSKIAVHMENMNAYERRIVHNILANNKKVTTKSEGEEPNRHVVINPIEE